jgi:hypothetical protein
MAKTPVPVRTPVVDEAEPVAEQVEEVVEVKRTPVPVKPVDEGGFRECAREGCGNRFKPRSLVVHDTDATEYYCSTECAVTAMWKKEGYGKPPSGGPRGKDEKKPIIDARQRAEKDAKKEEKYGPVREIAEVVREEGQRRIVKLDCGHERRVGKARKRARCRKCRVTEAPQSQETIRVEVEVKKPKREPVKAEKKAKRTPVKAKKEKKQRKKGKK